MLQKRHTGRSLASMARHSRIGVHSVDGVAVVNGGPNTLQFYNVLDDKHVAELSVARGAAASHIYAKPRAFTDAVVEQLALSPDRLTLVTVDRRTGITGSIAGVSEAVQATKLSDDMQLKFWSRASITDDFVLHTRVERAHTAPVTRLVSRRLFVTRC